MLIIHVKYVYTDLSRDVEHTESLYTSTWTFVKNLKYMLLLNEYLRDQPRSHVPICFL